MNFCQETVKAWFFVGILITIIKIVVPLLIIITSVIPIFNSIVKGNADETIKSWQIIAKKLAAALIVFLLPTLLLSIVKLLTSRDVVNNDVLICSECFNSPGGSKCKESIDKFNKEDEEDVKKFYEESISGSVDTSKLDDNKKQDNNSNNNGNNSNNNDNENSNNNGNNSQNNNESLESKIRNYINSNSAGGNWSVYVKNMSNGQTVNINANNKMISASIIKLFVMAATYDQIDKNAVSDNGSLRSNINSMITVSSNEATNNVINSLPGGMSTVNSYCSSNGYGSTSLNRYLGGSRTPENMTSAQDVGNLLEKIYKGQLPHSNEMLNMLKNQQVRHKIPSGIADNVVVANKTGELSDVENDSAIVYSGGDYVIVVLSQGVNNVSQAQGTVREISKIVYNDYK